MPAVVTKIPPKLYKYRHFSSQTLDALICDQVFFADPRSFNDPLDTSPSLDVDVDLTVLENVLRRLIELRVTAEKKAAAKSVSNPSDEYMRRIERLSEKLAEQEISDIHYNAQDTDGSIEECTRFLFRERIESELVRRYDMGVFSTAERSDCPLMWSHYGDEHRGICIGYSVPETAKRSLWKVKYSDSRLVAASAVAAMLEGDDDARRTVDDAVLARKASSWKYEREWRFVGTRGLEASPLELQEIVFGHLCSDTVKFALMNALAKRSRPVSFFKISEQHGSFKLKKQQFDSGYLFASLPKRSQDVYDSFSDL